MRVMLELDRQICTRPAGSRPVRIVLGEKLFLDLRREHSEAGPVAVMPGHFGDSEPPTYRHIPIEVVREAGKAAVCQLVVERDGGELMADAVYVSFLLGPIMDGRQRVEAVCEFASEAEAKADASNRLLMFGNAGWGRKTQDFGPAKDVVVDVTGRA